MISQSAYTGRFGRIDALGVIPLILVCLCLVACAQPIGNSKATLPSGLMRCGTVSQSAAGVTPSHPAAIEHCFFTAYQACRPATLAYSWAGVDTSTDHLFTTRSSGGHCEVDDAAHFHGCCSSVPQSSTTTYTCGGVKEADGRLTVLSCGADGDIQLP
jgi:hypothetical protein